MSGRTIIWDSLVFSSRLGVNWRRVGQGDFGGAGKELHQLPWEWERMDGHFVGRARPRCLQFVFYTQNR
jgi:hypothetical protein